MSEEMNEGQTLATSNLNRSVRTWAAGVLSDYGMLVALILLAGFFSWRTLALQFPVGAEAGKRAALQAIQEIAEPREALVAAGTGDDDRAFTEAAVNTLREVGFSVTAVNGTPRDLRLALEDATSGDPVRLDAIVLNQRYASLEFIENYRESFPALAPVKVFGPLPYYWPNFLKRDNLLNVANQIVVFAVLAIGMTMVIITAGIDLSVGSLVALGAVTGTLLIRDYGGGSEASVVAMFAGSIGGILLCGAVGFFSGAFVTFFAVPPFIVTLAMLMVASGLAFLLAEGQSIYQLPASYTWLGRGYLMGIPVAVWLMILLYLVAHIIMSHTVLGRYIYAVGGNAESARLSGVPVKSVLLFVYTVSGLLAGLGGIILASQLQSGSPQLGVTYELYVIAAVVVGGTSLMGGEGKMLGTLIGAFLIAIIRNGMNLTGVEAYTQKVVFGFVILAAVLLDTMKKRGVFRISRNRIARAKRPTGPSGLILLILFLSTPVMLQARERPKDDILIEDFEREKFGDFWTAEGEAFNLGPVAGTLGDQRPVTGYHGQRLVNTFNGGDLARGSLSSKTFEIDRRYINFLIGGGRMPGTAGIELMVDGEPVKTATGHAYGGGDSEHLRPHSWEVEDLIGREASLRLYDLSSIDWGHILIDHIVQSDSPTQVHFASEDIEMAMNSLLGALPWAENDPSRPIYHFHPPALWMNDPNAPFFRDGWFHIFYQHNPFGDRWDHMHWGHARSQDLVTWEHLPVALAPLEETGEVGVWSGSALQNELDQIVLYYTAIFSHTSAREYAEQWAVVPTDSELISWTRHPDNPVMTPAIHTDLRVYEWRDPYFFEAWGRQFCIIAGNVEKSEGIHRGTVFLYESLDTEHLEWVYRGILFEHPDPSITNIEVPGFFHLGDSWVLTITPPGVNEYYVGEFNQEALQFNPISKGLLDTSEHFFAPNSMETPDGRRVLWGWVRGFPADRGWNGVLTVPRLIQLSDRGKLKMLPLPELHRLRTSKEVHYSDLPLGPESILSGLNSANVEVIAEIETVDVSRLELEIGTLQFQFNTQAGTGNIEDHEISTDDIFEDDRFEIHILIDRSVVEVFLDQQIASTLIVDYPVTANTIVFRSNGNSPARLLTLDAWELDAILPKSAESQIRSFGSEF